MLSQVCSQWHSIVIGTPTFWTFFYLNGVLWSSLRLDTTLQLLSSALERGRDLAITVVVSHDHDWPLPRRIFHLLAQHSHRWHTAAFICPLDGINLAVLKGRLPLLKKLEINIPKSLSFHTRDFLDRTPLLDTLVVSSPFFDNVDSIL